MQFVILCAGRGERLKPLTNTMSKVMIPVANRPLLEWTVDSLEGIADEIIIVIRNDQKDIVDAFPNCKFVYQNESLGTANAIGCCKPHVKGSFIVMMGDDYFSRSDIDNMSRQKPFSAGYYSVDDSEKFGIFSINNNKITDIVEKPKNSTSKTANCGIYLFDGRIFDFIKKTEKSERGEYEITDSLKFMIKDGIEINAVEIKRWQPVGYPWHLLELNKVILEEHGAIVGKNVKMKPGARVENPVAIGDDAVIGPNCSIRKYSSIGKNCVVGNASEVKNSIVMDNTHIPHLNYVGDSVIGRNCNLAAGTVLANLRLDEKNIKMDIKGEKTDSGRRKLGCVIGDDVKFGVNVTVMPGKKIKNGLMIPPCVIIREDLEEQPAL